MDGSWLDTIDIGAVLINATGIILTAIVAFVVMYFTNRTAKQIQKRNERNTLCDDIEVLVAEYSTLIHKLYALTRSYGRNQGNIFLNQQTFDRIENTKDDLDTIIFKIELKINRIEGLDYLIPKLEVLKEEVTNYIVKELIVIREKTANIREELSNSLEEIRNTMK